jgi:hypothetical protein
LEKANNINLFKIYSQQLQATQRNTQGIPPQFASKPDSFEHSAVKSNDDRIYTDINGVRDTFKKFLTTARTLQYQVNALDDKTKNHEKTGIVKELLASFGWIIPFRRVTSVPDKVENKDYLGTAGAIAVAGLLLPEDLRDSMDGVKQVLSKALPRNFQARIAKKNRKFYKKYIRYKPKYNTKDYQVPFSFIRGTFLQSLVNKIGGKIGYYLHLWDKPLLATAFGKKIMSLLHVKITGRIFTGRKVPQIVKNDETGEYFKDDVKVLAEKLKGMAIGKTICRSLQRITVYGSLALAMIAIPAVVMAVKNSKTPEDKLKNGGKQTLKSVISVVSTLFGIGLGGALLAPMGAAGSVAGMAIGSALSAYISSKINKYIK